MLERGASLGVAMPVVAVIPMKPLEAAKSRLAPKLTQGQRQALALNMAEHVVRMACRASLHAVWVVGGGPAVRGLAQRNGAQWHEDETSGLNACLSQTFEMASEQHLAPLYLPGDLPLLDWPEIQGMVRSLRVGTGLVICPDQRNEGTNALLLSTATSFEPQLGLSSFRRHMDLAQSMGLTAAVYNSPGLAFDLDTPADLEELERRCPGILETLVQERVT